VNGFSGTLKINQHQATIPDALISHFAKNVLFIDDPSSEAGKRNG